MVSPSEWGPNAWSLLHGLAETVGYNRVISIAKDEKNEILLTLRYFGGLLPCKMCQTHYREWIQKNPPETFLKGVGENLRDEMRMWLWRLHENVNRTREGAEYQIHKVERNTRGSLFRGPRGLPNHVPQTTPVYQSPSIIYESLPALYSSIDLRAAASQLKSMYTRGIELRILKPEEWNIGWKHLDLLLRFINL